jgi:hypothetical protein
LKSLLAGFLKSEGAGGPYERTLEQKDMVAVLNNKDTPTSVLEAIFEAPHLVPAIPSEVKERLIGD